jgi:hypothetical protein
MEMKKTSALTALAVAGMVLFGSDAVSASPVAMATARSHGPSDPQEFETQAVDLLAFPRRYAEAIKLLLKAAGSREVGDPARVKDFVLASRLAYYRKDVDRSFSFMRHAADEAAATGDVITAAHAYVDAAFIGLKSTNIETIGSLVRRAELLAYSPLIGEQDRHGILVRIRVTP